MFLLQISQAIFSLPIFKCINIIVFRLSEDYVSQILRVKNAKPVVDTSEPKHRRQWKKTNRNAKEGKNEADRRKIRNENIHIFKRLKNIDEGRSKLAISINSRGIVVLVIN